MQDNTIMCAPVRTQNTDNAPTRQKLDAELVCAYLQLSNEGRELFRRFALALVNNDGSKLEALKADSPEESTPLLSQCIADIAGGEA